MAKRLTDSGKWDDPWFTELPNEHKLLWIYLLDKCDHAGFWKVNKRLAEFILNQKFDWQEVMVKFQHRLVTINPELWHLPKFIEFQYGQLSPNNRAHASAIQRLSKYEISDIKELASPLQGDKDKAKEKAKEKDKDILEGSRKPFGEEGLVLLTQVEHEKLIAKLGERKTAEYIARLENYIGSKGRKYKSHYHTILSWTLNPSTTGSFDIEKNPMNMNKTQLGNMEALSEFVERKRTSGPKDLRAGDGNTRLSLPGDKVQP